MTTISPAWPPRSLIALPPGWAVRAQSGARPGRSRRFGYVITDPTGMIFVSPFRYGSEATALTAGHADALAAANWEAVLRDDES